MKHFITLLLLSINLSLSAQMQLTPVDDYCFDLGTEIVGTQYVPLQDGSGYVVVGKSNLGSTYGKQHYGTQTVNLWNDDAFIAVVDNDFNVLKSNIFGGSLQNDDDDYFTKVIPQADGGFVCYGHCNTTDGDIQSPGIYSILLFKVDSNLNKVWSKPYGNTLSAMYVMDCIQSRDGGFIMLFGNGGPSGDNMIDLDGTPLRNDWTVVKTDSAGNKLWAKVYGSSKNLLFSNAQYAGSEAFFLRLDTAGMVQQVRTIGGDNGDQLHHIGLGPQPNTYFIGINNQSYYTGDMIDYGEGIFLCTIDQQNNFIMKYGLQSIGWNGLTSTFYNPIKSEVILSGTFAGGVSLFCDTTTVPGNFKKPAIRRLRFDPLGGLRQAGLDKRSLTLYPNPAQDKLYIKEEVPANSTIHIADMSGRVLKRVNYTNGEAIGLDGLNAGHYLITITNKKYTSTTTFSLFP